MKKIIVLAFVLALLCSPAQAFLYDLAVPAKEEITAMPDEKLVDFYIDILIERKAAEAFHGKAGFSPKEYGKFKELLGLIVDLRKEMVKRKLEAPPVDEWLR